MNVEQVAAEMAANEREHYALSNGTRVSCYTLRTLRLVYNMSDQALSDIFGVSGEEITGLSLTARCLRS